MEPGRNARLASSKRAYCLWYEFAQIAVNMKANELRAFDLEEPEITEAIKKAKRFYKPWDLDKRLDPDKWWGSHSHLFEETQEVRLLRAGEKPRDPNALIIEVPMIYSATRLKHIVGKLILTEMYKRTRLRYGDIEHSSAKYLLTPGKRLKYVAYDDLQVFIATCFANPGLKGTKLLEKVEKAYEKRKRETKVPVPIAYSFKWNNEDEVSKTLRNMRKNYWKSRMLLKNVIYGEFPGERY